MPWNVFAKICGWIICGNFNADFFGLPLDQTKWFLPYLTNHNILQYTKWHWSEQFKPISSTFNGTVQNTLYEAPVI